MALGATRLVPSGKRTTGSAGDSPARLTARRSKRGNLAVRLPAGSDLDQRTELSRHRQHAPERSELQGGSHPARIREHSEEQPAQQRLAERPLVFGFDRGPGRLDESVVADSRGTRADARHASEAAVEVLSDRVVEGHGSVEPRVHEVDPAARRIHLLVPEDERRARGEAEAAVDAVRRQLPDHAAGTPENTPLGSSCSRIARSRRRTSGAVSSGAVTGR